LDRATVFEQSFHVRHRLERYGAGRCMDYDAAGPAEIADAIAQEIGREVDCRDVERDGAARAAQLIAELLWIRRRWAGFCASISQTWGATSRPSSSIVRARLSPTPLQVGMPPAQAG
jgi:hypothetical protein